VSDACLEDAIADSATDDIDGIRAGLDARERNRIRKHRARASA